jgi:hypothetical protein
LIRISFLLGLFFDAEERGDVPPKRRLTFNRIQVVIPKKIELFITTTVRTSNPAFIDNHSVRNLIRFGAPEIKTASLQMNQNILFGGSINKVSKKTHTMFRLRNAWFKTTWGILSYITHIPDAKVYGKNPSDSVKAENFLII